MTQLLQSPALRQIEAHYAALPLMQRAGAAAAAWAAELAGERGQPILVLAGPGNNGGDAFEAARLLRELSFDVRLLFAADPARLPADAAAAYQRYTAAGGQTLSALPQVERWALIIDGLFGIGLTRPAEGRYAEWIAAANQLAERDQCPLLALDCPSGLNADTGLALAPVIQASHTLTFIAGKPGLLTADGPDYSGQIRIADLELNTWPPVAAGKQLGLDDFAVNLKKRAKNSHKGSFGSVGILGGGKSMVGAAFLAGRAALKLGAGRVYLGLLDPDAPTIDLVQPELMLRRADTLLQTDLQALACGPGLGQSSEARQLVEQALQTPLPLLLDADALNLIAADSQLASRLSQRPNPAILTPHPAEAARLLDCTVREIQADRIQSARQLATHYRSHIALKGCGTVIATADGRWWINPTGNPGMATAGMGDVLSGLITSLLAQNWPADQALLAGVYLHGMAADDLVAAGIGPVGLTAQETIDAARRRFNGWLG